MTTPPIEPQPWDGWDTQELVTRIGGMQESVAAMADSLHRMEYELLRRMEADGATAVAHPDYTVTLTRPVVWDKTQLWRLGELVSPEVLATCFQARHEEVVVVEDKWDMTKVKPLGKYGREVQEVLAAAQKQGAARLSVTPRETDHE